MNPADLQALRVAIALSDGWREKWKGEGYYGHPESKVDCRLDGLDNSFPLPDYPNCRDDIVAAALRRFVTERDKEEFARAIWKLAVGPPPFRTCEYSDIFAIATADAHTLARAYCAAAGISVEGVG